MPKWLSWNHCTALGCPMWARRGLDPRDNEDHREEEVVEDD